MKQFLYVIGFLLLFFLFNSNREGARLHVEIPQEEDVVMVETGKADMEQCLKALSDEMKHSNLLTPRRAFVPLSCHLASRAHSQIGKNIQFWRLKEHELITKLLENEAIQHRVNYSTLLCRNGYHVFALRKLLI